MSELEHIITIKHPDGTEKQIHGQGAISLEDQTLAFAWAINGLRFQFPVPDDKGKIFEFRMSKSDAKELRDWLIENLDE